MLCKVVEVKHTLHMYNFVCSYFLVIHPGTINIYITKCLSSP